MKTLFIATILCFSVSLAYPQTCPPNAVFQGVQMPVVQIRNQCFAYDNTGFVLEQGLLSLINVPHDVGDGDGVSDVRFTIRSAAVENYQHILTFDGCDPREQIRFIGRIAFDVNARVVFVPISMHGTARAEITIHRTYDAFASEGGTNLQAISSNISRSNVDINVDGIGYDLVAPLLEPIILDEIFGNEFEDLTPSIVKLDGRVIPFIAPEISGPSTICENSVTLSVPAGFDHYSWSTGSTASSIVVEEPGTYAVEIEHACNIATASKDVVKKDPIVNFIVTDLFCADKVSVSASGFESVQWSTGASTETIEVAASGVYKATVVDADGCQGEDQVSLNIHGPCMQALHVNAICSERPASLRRWLINNPNDMSVRLDWEVPGTLQRAWMDVPPGESTLTTTTARFNNANGIAIYWHDQSGQLQSFSAMGSEEKCPRIPAANPASTSSVNLYPNPARDHFLISVESDVEQELPFVIRSHGGMIRDEGSFRVSSGKNYIHYDLSKLMSGEYIMTMGRETIRFVKK